MKGSSDGEYAVPWVRRLHNFAESGISERLEAELDEFAARVHTLLAQGSPTGDTPAIDTLDQLALRNIFQELLLHIVTGISARFLFNFVAIDRFEMHSPAVTLKLKTSTPSLEGHSGWIHFVCKPACHFPSN